MTVELISSTREERWRFLGGEWKRTMLRLDSGEAARDFETKLVRATSRTSAAARDIVQATENETLFDCLLDRANLEGLVLRFVRTVSLLNTSEGSTSQSDERFVVASSHPAAGHRSVVATPGTLGAALDILLDFEPPVLSERPRLPMVWTNGTASVLLHEAIGHPAQAGDPAIEWPSWLEVADDPQRGPVIIGRDAIGRVPVAASLTEGGRPSSFRTETLRDVPLLRMSNLIAHHHHAPFELPDERVEVRLTSGGSYDSRSGEVTVDVCDAREVRPGSSRSLAPFQVRAPRRRVAAALRGATGDPVTYPGVICGTGGQQIVVGSAAPIMVTDGL